MTNEEAIKYFEARSLYDYKPLLDAAKLAIDALRAQQRSPLDGAGGRGATHATIPLESCLGLSLCR